MIKIENNKTNDRRTSDISSTIHRLVFVYWLMFVTLDRRRLPFLLMNYLAALPTHREDNFPLLFWKFPISTKNSPFLIVLYTHVIKVLSTFIKFEKSLKIKHFQYFKSCFWEKLPWQWLIWIRFGLDHDNINICVEN